MNKIQTATWRFAQASDGNPVTTTSVVLLFHVMLNIVEHVLEKLFFGEAFVHIFDLLFSFAAIAYSAYAVHWCAIYNSMNDKTQPAQESWAKSNDPEMPDTYHKGEHMTFEERCRLSEQCLPDAPYRAMLKKLHDEMLKALAKPKQGPTLQDQRKPTQELEALFTNIDHAISSGAWNVQKGSQTWEIIDEAKAAHGIKENT